MKDFVNFLRGIPDFYKLEFNIGNAKVFVNRVGVLVSIDQSSVRVGFTDFEKFLDEYINHVGSEVVININECDGSMVRYDRILDFMSFLMQRNVSFNAEYKTMRVKFVNWALMYKKQVRGSTWRTL